MPAPVQAPVRPRLLWSVASLVVLLLFAGATSAFAAPSAPAPRGTNEAGLPQANSAVVPGATDTDRIRWSVMPAESIGGQPRSQIDYTLQPGTTVTDSVVVANSGDEPVQLDLYATDAIATSDGAFAVLPASSEPVQLGSWITLEAAEVTLAPGEAREVGMSIAVPQDATPGDHAAGVLASRRTSATTSGGTELAVDQRVGTRVYVRVNGPLQPALTVTALDVNYDGSLYPFAAGPATVEYTITNTGNLRLAGRARIELLAPFGVGIAQSEPIEVPALLPGSSVSGRVHVDVPFPPGRLTVRLDLEGLNTAGTVPVQVPHERHSMTIWAMPWLVVGALGLLVALWWLRRRRIKTLIRNAAGSATPARDVQRDREEAGARTPVRSDRR